MAIADEPILTELHERAEAFSATADSTYVFGETSEERSRHLDTWRAAARNVEFIEVVGETPTSCTVRVDNRTPSEIALRSRVQLDALWKGRSSSKVFIDITGLSHHVWAPMLRSALTASREVAAIYVEPAHYSFSATPTEGQIFDLSERIRGIAPLPGFASLLPSRDAQSTFVPLLGFEGIRFAHVMEHVQPSNDRIIPVIGVPGFRAEYPFHTYAGNRRPLFETRAWHNVEFAAANCPFSLYYLLERIALRMPQSVLRIAPIGTKPHALGAVLFKLASNRFVDLVYDHPIRKAGRTRESKRLLVYHVSSFLRNAAP